MMLAFFIPVYQNVVPVFIVLLVVNWLFQIKQRANFGQLIRNKPALFLIGFYLWHIVAMFWSSNKSFGQFDLEIKLGLLLLPLVYATLPRLKTSELKRILFSYVIGCLVAIFIGVINSIYVYNIGESPFLDFYNNNISPLLHIGYFAMYLNMALIICIYLVTISEHRLYTWLNAGLIILSFLFALMVYLSTSRNGLISLILLASLVVIYALLKNRKWLIGTSIVLVVWIIATANFKTIALASFSNNQFELIKNTISNNNAVNANEGESTAVRILIWKSAIELIKSNPLLGTGTGDVKDELMRVYKERDYIHPYERQYNAHNQYLQTWVALGVIGILLLLSFFGFSIVESFLKANYLYMLFGINLSVSFLTESILEVQAGVVFVAFFVAILSPILMASPRKIFKTKKTLKT
jgi:O-antigen ligase